MGVGGELRKQENESKDSMLAMGLPSDKAGGTVKFTPTPFVYTEKCLIVPKRVKGKSRQMAVRWSK